MRVGLLIGRNQIGGAERQVSLLAQGLHAQGVPVTVFFMSRPIPFDRGNRFDFGGIRCVHLWDTRFTRSLSIRYFARCLKRHRIDVLHMFNLGAVEYGLPAARLAAVTHTIGSVRGIIFSVDSAIRSRLTKVCREVAFITCNCKAIRDLMVDCTVCAPEKIRIIRNGIVPGEGAGKRVPRKEKDGFCVILVGTLKDVKDPLCFVKSAFRVLESQAGCTFLIAGDGELRGEVERMISGSRWAQRFSLLGRVPPEKIPYGRADLLVSTSKREGSSNAVLEALANGLPVVGTHVGGTRELLTGKPFGRLVAPGDTEAIARAIREFYDKDENDLERLSREALAFIREHHSVDRLVAQHLDLYQEVLSG